MFLRLSLAALLTLQLALPPAHPQSHNLIVGAITLCKDKVLHTQTVRQLAVPRQYVSTVFKYPRKGVVSHDVISFIDADDVSNDGTGGYAKIIAGGVGQKTVTIEFRSQLGHGFKFMLKIYGKK